MTSLIRAAAFLLMLPALVLAESPVDGTWTGEIAGDGAAQPITFVMRADDTAVTGSILSNDGIETSIEDGTLFGNTLKLTTVQRNDPNKPSVQCTGTVIGESITFTCTADGQADSRDFVVTRQKQ